MSRALTGLASILILALFARSAWAADLDPPVNYTIKAGDSLYLIGRKFLASRGAYLQLQRLNKIRNPRRLQPGQVIVVPGRLLKVEPIQARVAAFSGPVTIDAGDGAKPARLNQAIGRGAVISTGANAFTTLQLPDDSRITLPSQSRMRIQRLRHILLTGAVDRVFAIEKGRSESVVTPLPSPSSRYLIITPVGSSAVRGTVFRVAFDEASGRAATEVVKGVVTVAGSDAQPEVQAQAGFGVRTGPDGDPVQAALLPGPKLEDGGRLQDGRVAAFTVIPLQGAKAYRLQLATDAGFIEIIREAETETGAAAFDSLADGAYFVRATAIDDNGLEGLPNAYAFIRELNAIEGGAPAVSGEGRMRRYLFRWNAVGAGVKSFRFQLFDKPGAPFPMIDQPGLESPMITIANLPPGAYQWRVVVSTSNQGRYTEKAGDLQALQVGQQPRP